MEDNMITSEKPMFELRGLKVKDVAPMTTILTQIGLREFKNVLSGSDITDFLDKITESKEEGKDVDIEFAVGAATAIEVVGVIISNYPKCEKALLTWLGDLSGMKAEEVGDLPMPALMEMLICIAQKDEFADFFKVASKLLS